MQSLSRLHIHDTRHARGCAQSYSSHIVGDCGHCVVFWLDVDWEGKGDSGDNADTSTNKQGIWTLQPLPGRGCRRDAVGLRPADGIEADRFIDATGEHALVLSGGDQQL